MKKYTTHMKQIIYMTLVAMLAWSCIHENFDEPPVGKTYDFEANTTIAELEAIRKGLAEIKNPELPVRVYTDSRYVSDAVNKK